MKKALMGAATVAAVVGLSACQSTDPVQVADGAQPQQDTCGLAAAQQFIGQKASVLDTYDFAGPVRILHPNTAATMDFRENRLNFSVDANGVITKAYCA